jgi:hypothetical protein
MAKKTGRKSGKHKSKPASRRKTNGRAKFAGVVELTAPTGGRSAALANGSHIVVSLVELHVGRLPEDGARAELQFDAMLRTTTENGKSVSGSWSPGLFYYVPHGSRLNVADVVIFDGVVHQHLSFDLELVEREMPRMDRNDAAVLAEAAAAAAADLVGASGPLGTAFDAFPRLLGGILKLNGDDQVLKYVTSLYTGNVGLPEDSSHYLIEGRYLIVKKRSPEDEAASVTLVLDIRRVR